MAPQDDGGWACPTCTSDEAANEPRLCDYCQAAATSTRDENGLYICELCAVQVEFSPDAVAEVLAIHEKMEHVQNRRVSIDEAITEWFARFLDPPLPDQAGAGLESNGGITHGAS